MATGSALTNYAENAILQWLLTSTTPVKPTSWTVSLHTADPTETGTVAEVPSTGSYARAAVTFAAPSGGSTSNNGTPVTFPTATGTWGNVTHAAVWDQAGNCLLYGPLGANASITNGITYSFPLGQLIASLD